MQYPAKNDGRRYGRNLPAATTVSQQARVLCHKLNDFSVLLLLLLHSRKTIFTSMDHYFFGNDIKIYLVYLNMQYIVNIYSLGLGGGLYHGALGSSDW